MYNDGQQITEDSVVVDRNRERVNGSSKTATPLKERPQSFENTKNVIRRRIRKKIERNNEEISEYQKALVGESHLSKSEMDKMEQRINTLLKRNSYLEIIGSVKYTSYRFIRFRSSRPIRVVRSAFKGLKKIAVFLKNKLSKLDLSDFDEKDINSAIQRGFNNDKGSAEETQNSKENQNISESNIGNGKYYQEGSSLYSVPAGKIIQDDIKFDNPTPDVNEQETAKDDNVIYQGQNPEFDNPTPDGDEHETAKDDNVIYQGQNPEFDNPTPDGDEHETAKDDNVIYQGQNPEFDNPTPDGDEHETAKDDNVIYQGQNPEFDNPTPDGDEQGTAEKEYEEEDTYEPQAAKLDSMEFNSDEEHDVDVADNQFATIDALLRQVDDETQKGKEIRHKIETEEEKVAEKKQLSDKKVEELLAKQQYLEAKLNEIRRENVQLEKELNDISIQGEHYDSLTENAERRVNVINETLNATSTSHDYDSDETVTVEIPLYDSDVGFSGYEDSPKSK